MKEVMASTDIIVLFVKTRDWDSGVLLIKIPVNPIFISCKLKRKKEIMYSFRFS